jgi:hypothetical protein
MDRCWPTNSKADTGYVTLRGLASVRVSLDFPFERLLLRRMSPAKAAMSNRTDNVHS